MPGERPYFLVFAGDGHEPEGGWRDIVGCNYERREQAIEAAEQAITQHGNGWAHVVNLDVPGDPVIVHSIEKDWRHQTLVRDPDGRV